MTGDRGNDRDNQKIVGLGCLGRNIPITTFAVSAARVKKNFGSVLRSFIISRALIGFPASSDGYDEKTLLDQEITTNFCVFHEHF